MLNKQRNIWGTISKYQNGMANWRCPEKILTLGRSGTQHFAIVTKLSSSYCGAHLVESYRKESNISVTNWRRYLSPSYLIRIWLSVRHHQLANLHISKTWIYLERKEVFENIKQHSSSYTDYFLCFKMASIGKMRFSSKYHFKPYRSRKQ